MLDIKMLIDMPAGTVFAKGEAMDSSDGLHMANTGRKLRWVAVRGHAQGDWSIYCQMATWNFDAIRRNGDKVSDPKNIKKCVPCDDEALAHYRH